jgi:hypothetical protein
MNRHVSLWMVLGGCLALVVLLLLLIPAGLCATGLLLECHP